MKKIAALTILASLILVSTLDAQECTTITFEDLDTGTSVVGEYAISPLLSIDGQGMEVVEEGQGPGILAYNSNLDGISNNPAGGQNWLPGDNAKSFGNASGVSGATSQDLTITFNPDIVVESFSIDLFDYGDWFPGATNPVPGGNPRVATLTAYDSDDNPLGTDELSIDYSLDNDVWTLWDATGDGARNLSVTFSDIAYVKLTFAVGDVDPGITFDNIEICYLQQYCETAYAYDGEDGTCFSDLGFSNWGWSIEIAEGEHTFDLYAGAGQCDLDNGMLVGTVTIDYSGGTVEVLDVDTGDYSLSELHVYAGDDPVPSDKKGKPTVAPGQYTIGTGLSGDIYVIVHAVVCWYE